MHIFNEIEPLRAYLKDERARGFSIGLVPTMGALHAGHVSLVHTCRTENEVTVATIYVNPTQFNNPEDLAKYPRTLEADLLALKQAGCDAVFCPSNEVMYGDSEEMHLDFGPLDKILEGKFRPGHFSGVGKVVAKLFNIVQPDRAYFGQKDYQQFKVIERLTTGLKFPIQLVCHPIVREPDGLAMSSRNKRLTSEQRIQAIVLYESLGLAKQRLQKGERLSIIQEEVALVCDRRHVRLEYLALAATQHFHLLERIEPSIPCILLIAGYAGEVRLIDNSMFAD